LTIGGAHVEPDGLTFAMNPLSIEPIRDEAEYHGLRAKFSAYLGNIRIPMQVDVGIGDRMWPAAEYILYPTLLDMPAPRVQVCRKETTIVEKLDAMLELGITNSRMKDFYDIAVLGDLFSFAGRDLQEGVRALHDKEVLANLPDLPIAFSQDFAQNEEKKIQWRAFLRRIGRDAREMPLGQVVDKIRIFLLPILQSLKAAKEFDEFWPPGGPWRAREKGHDG
jgi:hypothetical protein